MTTAAGPVGYMPMPPNFKYRDVFLKGKPQHERWDSFLIKHPPMPAGRWAKIFSPFDALKGFDEAVASKDIQYVDRAGPNEDSLRELNRRLDLLRSLTRSSHLARANRVTVTVKYFVPCSDADSFAYGIDGVGRQGRYETVSGMVLHVDPEIEKTLTLQTGREKAVISFEDILEIENDTGIFNTEREAGSRITVPRPISP